MVRQAIDDAILLRSCDGEEPIDALEEVHAPVFRGDVDAGRQIPH